MIQFSLQIWANYHSFNFVTCHFLESYSFMRDTLLGVMERSTVQLILPKERYSSINGAVSGFFFFLLIVDFGEKLFCWSSWYLSDTRAMWQLSVSVLQGHKWTEFSFLLLSSIVAWSLNSSDCHQFGKLFIYIHIYYYSLGVNTDKYMAFARQQVSRMI